MMKLRPRKRERHLRRSPYGRLSREAAAILRAGPAPCQPLLVCLRLSQGDWENRERGGAKAPPAPVKAMVPGEWAAVQPPGAGWLIADARPLPWTVTQAPDRRDL